jgi:thiol-disulfide isomerase/thioredoxin
MNYLIPPFLLLATPVLLASPQASQPPLSNGKATLELQDLSGQPQSLSHLKGNIVVLNFWATWCVPCREEMPLLVSLQKHYEARGVQVIAASADDESTQKEVPEFARKLKINFPVWVGATIGDMQRLGLGSALPATAVIDRDGRIVGRIIGIVNKADLHHRIEWLLGDRQTPAPLPLINTIETHSHDHKHEGEEEHQHASVGVEGASTVPS